MGLSFGITAQASCGFLFKYITVMYKVAVQHTQHCSRLSLELPIYNKKNVCLHVLSTLVAEVGSFVVHSFFSLGLVCT